MAIHRLAGTFVEIAKHMREVITLFQAYQLARYGSCKGPGVDTFFFAKGHRTTRRVALNGLNFFMSEASSIRTENSVTAIHSANAIEFKIPILP